jgi:hypothetical protein
LALVLRRGEAGLLALGADLEAGVDAFFAATGFNAVAGFLALGFLAGACESACTAGLAACFIGEDAFGW